MKYNDKYDLYLDDDFVIYYWNKRLNKLMQSIIYIQNGYQRVNTKLGRKRVHRIIYETFVGQIPYGYEIDHVDTNKNNNSLNNLKLVTHTENMNNPITKKKISESHKGKTTSEFGIKFKEHYGINAYQNYRLYHKELLWYYRNNKCRWE